MFSKTKLLLLGSLLFIFLPTVTLARENVYNWYIDDFKTEIRVEKDSSLDITEWITADCGQSVGKHGIFRILPETIKIEGKTIDLPVKLISITDFDGHKIKYSESRDYIDKTITWKIGDPDKTVQGVNYYKIHYQVKNTIRFNNSNFDELYWNLTGNFWELEIDNFQADIIFPEEITSSNSQVEYYTGYLGEKRKDLASFFWKDNHTLSFVSSQTLLASQGITASITFPKNIISPYKKSFWEKYSLYFWGIIPLVAFFICFRLWWKYGRDPRIDKTIIAEYEVPGNLTPMELGMLMNNGAFSNDLVTAEIINLATKGLLTIERKESKIVFFHLKDYIFTKKSDPKKEEMLTKAQRKIFKKIFAEGDQVKLTDLKNDFHEILDDLGEKTRKDLEEKNLLTKKGYHFSLNFILIGIGSFVFCFLSLVFWEALPIPFLISLAVAGVIVFLFGLAMPKRTFAGAQLNWQTKGFKLFMETVDKHRAEFYEKENIFEKFLPFAIVFGITGIWIKKMKDIYGADYYAKNAPLWYIGGNGAGFDADSFSSAMDSLSSSIATNTSSPSGSGGAGGSGGGGGGGGGGGW